MLGRTTATEMQGLYEDMYNKAHAMKKPDEEKKKNRLRDWDLQLIPDTSS